MKLNIADGKVVTEDDWSKFVEEVYGRPYRLQQQGEKLSGGAYITLPVPYLYPEDEEMNDVSMDELKPGQYGVKFDRWIQEEDIPLKWQGSWHKFRRRFFPDIYTLANDLHKKGVLEEGYYVIII